MLLTQLWELQGWASSKMQRGPVRFKIVQLAQMSKQSTECCDQWIRSASAGKSGEKNLQRGKRGTILLLSRYNFGKVIRLFTAALIAFHPRGLPPGTSQKWRNLVTFFVPSAVWMWALYSLSFSLTYSFCLFASSYAFWICPIQVSVLFLFFFYLCFKYHPAYVMWLNYATCLLFGKKGTD